MISCRIDWFDLLEVQVNLKSLLQQMTLGIAVTSPFSWEAFDGGWALLLDVVHAAVQALTNSIRKPVCLLRLS